MTILGDQKEALTSGLKPDITHARKPLLVYVARGSEYGSVKYTRGNYLRPTGGEEHDLPTPADLRRYRAYLRATVGHLLDTLDAIEHAEARHGAEFGGVHAMQAAASAPVTDGDRPSFLPHVAHAAASLNMALAQAIACGLLPEDPGQPWTKPVGERTSYEVLTDGLKPLLKLDLSKLTKDDACRHESWETLVYGGRHCADCKVYMAPDHSPAPKTTKAPRKRSPRTKAK
jgi:hypothetical protein